MSPIFEDVLRIAPLIVMVTAIGVGGWVFTTWLRIKNGYPLDGAPFSFLYSSISLSI